MKLKNKKRLFEEFKSIPDFRTHKHKVQFPLEEIVFMSLFALLQGVSEYRSIHTWCICNAKSHLQIQTNDYKQLQSSSFHFKNNHLQGVNSDF